MVSLDICNNENSFYCFSSNLEEKIKNCDQFSGDLQFSKTRYQVQVGTFIMGVINSF